MVDPDIASRHRTCELVRSATDAAIDVAGTAAEALVALDGAAGRDVCLVIARLALPDSTGLDLWHELQGRTRRHEQTACILVGAEIGDDAAAMAIAAGVDVLHAPLRATEVAVRVRRALVQRAERAASAARQRRLSNRLRRLQRRRLELEKLVHVDSLTGIVNRRHLEELLDIEIRRAHRERTDLAVIIIDVDFFHEFNEAHGHLEGDQCLVRIASAIAGELRRPSDVVGRYGGDEMVVLLPRTDAGGAARVAERVRRAIERAGIPHETSLGSVVTASLGVGVLAAGQGASAGELLATADWALLEAKRRGRNQFHAPDLEPPASPLPAPAGTWPLPVRVDPTLYDRVPEVLERKRDEVAALTATEPRRALALAADLKNLGRELGFTVVARLGARLDRAVRASDHEAVTRITAELRAYLERVPVIYLRA